MTPWLGWRSPRVNTCAGTGLPPEDSEDILQETLLIYLIKHDEIYNPEAWLRGALRKRCQFYWRRRQKTC